MKALLVVPPIYDFSAYDFWMKPYGFLQLASVLKQRGFEIDFFDFMDRTQPEMLSKTGSFGRGKFLRQQIETPQVLSDIEHPFCRYGLPEKSFREYLTNVEKPDFVMITCAMTYWYPGILEVCDIIRKHFKGVPIILGGAYAILCKQHALQVVAPDLLVGTDFHPLSEFLNIEISRGDVENALPAWELYEKLEFGAIKLNIGCPFRCTYCASHVLNPIFRTRPLKTVLSEVDRLAELGIRDIAFYDDALFVNAEKSLIPFLAEVLKKHKNLRFHTPNALHARLVKPEIAQTLKDSGFETIHIGFETANIERQQETGGKVTSDEFRKAIDNLLHAGFKHTQIITYLLVGLPEQPFEEILTSINEVSNLGIRVMLAEYSPIPSTPLFEKAKKYTNLDDPLTQNTSVFALRYFGKEKLQDIKRLKNFRNQNLLIDD
ncbi:MAG: radical SAM protein [Planctomycetes bacterium]|nr:radical SAM protein [Planctomycetota bacterium]